MNKLQITPKMKVSELLDNFPDLEDKLIEIVPSFNKLQNPILRETLAKVTTLQQVSNVGGVSLADLINKLRLATGQNKIDVDEEKSSKNQQPNWISDENIKITYDARTDLENGKHPLAKLTKEISTLNDNELYLLITPFLPGPLINVVKEQGFKVYSMGKTMGEVYTYIKTK